MSYATLADLKTYLKVTANTEDALLQSFLDEATGIIDEYVGRPSAATTPVARTFTADHDADGAMLMFDCDYAAAISSVVHDGTTLQSSDFYTEPRQTGPYWGLSLKSGQWSGDIEVTGLWAYTTNANGSADALIVGACRALAAWLYRAKDNVGQLVGNPYNDGVTIVNAALPRDVIERLQMRKRLI